MCIPLIFALASLMVISLLTMIVRNSGMFFSHIFLEEDEDFASQ